MTVRINNAEQGSEEWHRARAGVFTASRAGDLMARQKNGKPYASRKDYITQIALERVTGELPEQITSAAMQEGIEREKQSKLAYEFKTGRELEDTGLWYADFFGASPDALIVGENGGVEFKNPKSSTHYKTLKTGIVPETYYWQVLQNLLVTGKDFWDYVSYHPSFPLNSQLFIKTIKREDVKDDIANLVLELSKANEEANEEVTFINEYKEPE